MHNKNFDDKFIFLLDTLKNLQLEVNNEYRDYEKKVTKYRAQNPKIAKSVCDNLISGYSLSESLVITALTHDITIERARVAYQAHNNATQQIKAYAKNYLIHTLKKRGFKINDIAFILGVTKQTVYNYIKRPCIM